VYPFPVIQRLYVNNFRCLENFDLRLSGQSSLLLIGKNGSGKSTVGQVLEIFQGIARGTSQVMDWIGPEDFAQGRTKVPIRFEIQVKLGKSFYGYTISFELPGDSKEIRVLDEKLTVDEKPVFIRELDQVYPGNTPQGRDAEFRIDWHLVALPIVHERSRHDPLFIFKQWLANMLILRPIPSWIHGNSDNETLRPNIQISNFGAWFSGLLAHAPSAYTKIDEYLKQVMPDLKDIKNPVVGANSRSLEVQFSKDQASVTLPFDDLSDGEKCFMICALVLAANDAYGPLFCFWDEPDNYLALDEVGHFVVALRKAFQSGGQFIATSHNQEAISRFSDENTLYLYRNSHLEPTIVRPVKEMQYSGDLVDALVRGDVEP
jgi:predicted ATPase